MATGLVLFGIAGCSRPAEVEAADAASTPPPAAPIASLQSPIRAAAEAKWPAFYRAITEAAAPCEEAYAELVRSRSGAQQTVFMQANRASVACDEASKEISGTVRPKVGDEMIYTALDMWAAKASALAQDRAAIAEGFRGLDAPDQDAINERLIAEEATKASEQDAFLADAITMSDGGPRPDWAT